MVKMEHISPKFTPHSRIVAFPGDCLDLLRTIPDDMVQLVVTSPPYNIGKEYYWGPWILFSGS